VHYYALVDPPEFPASRPLALLRRPGPTGPLEHLGRDGAWWPARQPALVSGEDLRDLVEITVDQAEQLKQQWIGRS
jgi:hypothetical protein